MIYRIVQDQYYDFNTNLGLAIEVQKKGKILRNGVRIGRKTIPKYIKARQMLKDWAISIKKEKGKVVA